MCSNCSNENEWSRIYISSQGPQPTVGRYVNSSDISIPVGYQIEVFAKGLDAPSSMAFTENSDLIIAESGYFSQYPKILRLRNGDYEFITDGFRSPVLGLNYIRGNIYVSDKCHIVMIKPDRTKNDIISGLPSNGDYGNSKVVLGNDDKIYWGQGTATNSGVVGADNSWVHDCPLLHDSPGAYIILTGQNFETKNVLVEKTEMVSTGAFSPFGVPNQPYEIRKAEKKATGSILRANLDGTGLELMAWGLRNPTFIRFDHSYRLFASNQGFNDRGSRPIVNAPDEFQLIQQGQWYGWPDFAGGEPVTLSRFRPEGEQQPEFLLTNHPTIPPRPFAVFPAYSGVMGFDFNYDNKFGPYGDAYIAEFGGVSMRANGNFTPYAGYGHRISKVDINTGAVTTFAINKSGFPATISGEGGFGRPVEVLFGPDGALYILDAGIISPDYPYSYLPYSGVIWRISKTNR